MRIQNRILKIFKEERRPIRTLKFQSLTPLAKVHLGFLPTPFPISYFFKSALPPPWQRWQWLTTYDETWKKKVLYFGRITRNVIPKVATYAERLETGLQRHRTNKCKADVSISISRSLNRLTFPRNEKSPSRIVLSGWVSYDVILRHDSNNRKKPNAYTCGIGDGSGISND